ncbi:MAG: TetR/AcrR family transcriptional regulator [Wenzhouxiangellaceae bacterium]
MSKKETRRHEIITRLADYFLHNGLGDSGLRRLAEVTDTSDRMLLYYFTNKDELVAAVLMQISTDLARQLDSSFPSHPLKPGVALELLWQMTKSGALTNQLRLWLEMSGAANRDHPLYSPIVKQISSDWIAWLSELLECPESQGSAIAVLILSTIDGQVIMFPNDLGQGDSAIDLLKQLLDKHFTGTAEQAC